MEIIYFFEYRFPKPADFHFEMKQSSPASPGARLILCCPERPRGPFLQILEHPSAQGCGQRPSEPRFFRPKIISGETHPYTV